MTEDKYKELENRIKQLETKLEESGRRIEALIYKDIALSNDISTIKTSKVYFY